MSNENPRKYGNPPFKIAVIHGGPGAPGEMAPVAQSLSSQWGILEPMQTATSLGGQIDELADILQANANLPATLIGFSWGAWLSFLVAAKFPGHVRKLILIGSGPFDERYAKKIMETRLARLNKDDQTKVQHTIKILDDPKSNDKNGALAQFGELLSKTDTFKLISDEQEKLEAIECDSAIYQNVWAEASELRRSGRLLEFGNLIQCPVVAIHGDYDPHPADGVAKPLAGIIKNFRFIHLKNCGHKPWIERYAREIFYQILSEELR